MAGAYKTLEQLLLHEYGAVVGGRNLRKALGFETTAAFARAVRSGHLDLELFEMPGRKGRFAHVTDLAAWILKAQASGKNSSKDKLSEEPKM